MGRASTIVQPMGTGSRIRNNGTSRSSVNWWAALLVSLAYVGSKGTRLPSQLSPLNVLNPSLMSMGSQLTDQFGPDDTVVDGVAAPYAGWAQQLLAANNCQPTVAQALLPYPQFCSSLTGLNENLGSSIYHSFQLKVEKRYSHGLYTLMARSSRSRLSSPHASVTWADFAARHFG